MRAELLFPSLYLREADLKGKDVTLTIEAVQLETLQMAGGRAETRPVVYFVETAKKAETLPFEDTKKMKDNTSRKTTEKRLVLNKTNTKSIMKMHGNETDTWTGKKVTLYPTTTKFGKEMHTCIRIREEMR